MSEIITCTPRFLPDDLLLSAASIAIQVNPDNQPLRPHVPRAGSGEAPSPRQLALDTDRRWPKSGAFLTVGFLDNPSPDLRRRILAHMNAWSTTANVQFTESNTDPQVRIARVDWPPEEAGYWSLVGTDILKIAADQPTMNLQGFTMLTPEAEFKRVVRHETGHTLGFPHEHLRRELVEKIDPVKAIQHYGEYYNWSPDKVRRQVLTSLEDGSLIATPKPDPNSIMCYQIPGSLTLDGRPIIGGEDISELDYAFVATIYPKTGAL